MERVQPDTNEPLSAEVVLRDSAGASALRQWFVRRGFTTSAPAGISFSVTGPRSLFEDTFHVQFDEAGNRPGHEVLELTLPELPDELADAVDAVTFSEPPDFGPTSY